MAAKLARIAGHPNLSRAGRKKGQVNKTTASVKQALTEAFDQRGGVPALLKWAKENETPFYQLWGKLAPQEVHGAAAGPLVVSVVFSNE
jgi:hypothetical protein